MTVAINILCGIMIALSIFLIIAVLMQSGKDSRMSGTIAGGAETFFGKTKGKAIDSVLSKATTVVSVIFVVLVLAVYILQGFQTKNDLNASSQGSSSAGSSEPAVTETAETETAPAETGAEEQTTNQENTTAEESTAE